MYFVNLKALHSSIGVRAKLFWKDGTRFALRRDEGQARFFCDAVEGLFICLKIDRPTDNITQHYTGNISTKRGILLHKWAIETCNCQVHN